MTSFIAWIAEDCKGYDKKVSSLNFASDSRISWGDTEKYEMGKKLFFSQHFPEVFGFTGDVLICYLILNHLVNIIDTTTLLSGINSISEKQRIIFSEINKVKDSFPVSRIANFSIYYGTRVGEGNDCSFGLLKVRYKKPSLTKESLDFKKTNFYIDGSGMYSLDKKTFEWKNEESKEKKLLSREVFGAFCESINSNEDVRTNNIAQIVSLYRKFNAIPIGYVDMEKRLFLYGVECNKNLIKDNRNMQFRDHLFQRCGKNGEIIANAQRQPKIIK